MDHQKIVTAGIAIFVVAWALTFAMYKQEWNEGEESPFSSEEIHEITSGAAPSQSAQPLPSADEAVLQKQLQETVAKGNDADCETLGDPRYVVACHDFIRLQKK